MVTLRYRLLSASFFALITCVFGIIALFFTWLPLGEYKGSSHWIQVPCSIVQSELIPGNDESWNYTIRYNYRYDDHPYEGQRYSFDNVTIGGGPGDLPPVVPLGHGTCYVNPHKPWKAVLSKELRPIFWPGFYISTGATIFGLLITMATFFFAHNYRK